MGASDRGFMYLRTVTRRVSVAMLFISAATMVAGLLFGNVEAPRLFLTGLTGWLVAATGYLAGRSDITATMLEESRQCGFDEGYAAGRQVARPVVVSMMQDVG